jgi:hypothetical protein
MPEHRNRKILAGQSDAGPDVPSSAPSAPASGFDPGFILRMQEIAAAGLNPSSALELIIRLIAEVPAASKESMEQIKMLDKLLNTARAMMETRLKNEEAAELSSRLEKLEAGLFDFLRNSSEAPESVQSPEHDSTEHP